MNDVIINGTTFHTPNLQGKTKAWFIEKYNGLVKFDLDNAWDKIQKEIKRYNNEQENK